MASGEYTGIDRVEQAYVNYLLAQPGEVWFLTRGLGGFGILDRDGMTELMAHVRREKPLDAPDLYSRLSRRQTVAKKRAESTMRRLAAYKTSGWRLETTLRRAIGRPFIYINTSHSNRRRSRQVAIRQAGARTVAMMVHDLIPLEFPQYSSPNQGDKFTIVVERSALLSDVVLYNSVDTQERVETWLKARGISVPGIAASLGTTELVPGNGPTPPAPFFLCVGTIEPRKNHKLLLSVWNRFWTGPKDGPRPRLEIAGRRGWENQDVLELLDTAPYMGELVFERRASDTEIADMLGAAQALLFPTYVEGYGLPVCEAMSVGCPVICSDIGILREVGGDYPTYLDPDDEDAWFEAIAQASRGPVPARQPAPVPTWEAHFDTVFGQLAEIDAARQAAE